jgi:hypothetical protein
LREGQGTEEDRDSKPSGRAGIVGLDALCRVGWDKLWAMTNGIDQLKVSPYSAALRRHGVSAIEAKRVFDRVIRKLEEARLAVIHTNDK